MAKMHVLKDRGTRRRCWAAVLLLSGAAAGTEAGTAAAGESAMAAANGSAAWTSAAAGSAAIPGAPTEADPSPALAFVDGARRIEYRSLEDMERLFQRWGFGAQSWRQALPEIPRLYLSHIPRRWREQTAPTLDIEAKKQLFFRSVTPLALRANERVLAERTRLQGLELLLAAGGELPVAEANWLAALAERYGLQRRTPLGAEEQIRRLKRRVDALPVSLIVAAAAEESGWGTSRFADEGNALFGQWTRGQGLKPRRQRPAHADYRVKAFTSPLESVHSYLLNINRHPAYGPLREARAKLRAAREPLSGLVLVRHLRAYSERGEAYVAALTSLIRGNDLEALDRARLRDMRPHYLVAVGEGAE